MIERPCEACGARLTPNAPANTRYCSPRCRPSSRQATLAQRKCADCGARLPFTAGRSKFCSNACRQRSHRRTSPHEGWVSHYRQRAKKFGFEPVIESFTREDLIARYGDACHHCGGPFEELDHYPVPVLAGGAHSLDNCVPSCTPCNANSWRSTALATPST